ncbi:MAG: sensor histidine kinase [Anaerolineaceae bacterium]|nr:sensor histidine kinase [Anaerolineaceae bacterium]
MKKNYSPFALYAYLSIVLTTVVLLTRLLVKVNTPWWLILILLVLIGLGGLVPVTSRLEMMQRMLGNLKLGMAFPTIRQRWPDPLYPLLQQMQEMSNLDQDITNLREGWMVQVAQGAAQEERNRLARELHDSIKQQLFSIQMSAGAMQQRWESDPDGARKALDDLQQSTQEALAEMNTLLLQLSPAPLERVGLVQAIQEQCQALGYRSGAQVDYEIGELPDDILLPSGWQESIFRMVQESFSNIARHARATQVLLSLQKDDPGQRLVLKIEDNGQGLSPSGDTSGQGMRGILQRAEALGGQAQFSSKLGQGVSIQVELPLLTVELDKDLDLPVDKRLNRLAWISLLGGVLSAAAFVPIVLAQTGIYLGMAVLNGIWLWLALVIGLLVATGWLAGRFVPAGNRSAQILQSALAGIGGSIIAYGALLAASPAIQGMDALLNYGLKPASETQTSVLIIDAALGIFAWTHAAFWILILIGAGLGAIGGLLAAYQSDTKTSISEMAWKPITAVLIAGSSCTYLFGALVLPAMEAVMFENAMKFGVSRELRFLPHFAPFLVLTTPLFILLLSLGYQYRKLSQDMKSGTVQKLEQVHWSSFNLAVLSFGVAATSSLLGWITLEDIPTTSAAFILGAALLLVTNAIFFLRLTVRSRYQLKARLGPGWLWLLYVIPALVVLLPGFLLATLYEVFSAWVLVLYLALLLGFALAYSLLPQSARPTSRLAEIKQKAIELNNNWLAAALSLIVPAFPMGSAGLAIISVVIPFVQPLDSKRLPGWVSNGDTIASLLREDLLAWQPLGFVILLVVGLVLVGLWAFFTHLRILNTQRRR